MTVAHSSDNPVGPTGRPLWRRVLEGWAKGCALGQVTIVYPDGSRAVFGGREPGPNAELRVVRGRMVRRLILGGEVAFAESYMDGDWTTPDLTAVLEFGLLNEKTLQGPMTASVLMRMIAALRHRLHANTRTGAKRNIAYHYDLGNDFYTEWLDRSMTYSSAVFTDLTMTLEEAQRQKYRTIIEKLGIRQGDRVLEIGCGWGGFAELAASEAGAHVTSITLSREQSKYARERIEKAGLSDRVKILIEDYRDVSGTFDKIVSIEMFEAVGEENWPAYFNTVRDRLAKGGKALLQIITIADDRFETYRKTVDFIQRYIFPGGMLPSPSALAREVMQAGLRLVPDTQYYGASYAETVRRWNERFQGQWDPIKAIGFDDRFRRMWTYYLNSCEACFKTGATDVGHFVVEKPH